jgi:6-phosphogluconolactonase
MAASSGASAISFTPKFAYVANNVSNTVSAYSINPTSGALTPVTGSPFADGALPKAMTSDPTGRFVFAANECADSGCSSALGSVSAYSVNPLTGAITPVAGSPFPAGQLVSSPAIDPTGRFLYVSNENDHTISGFAIDPSTGVLTTIVGSPFPTFSGLLGLTMDPSSGFVFFTEACSTCAPSQVISSTSLDPSSGAFGTGGAATAAGNFPISPAVHPSGKFIYVVNKNDNSLSGFSIDPTHGTMTPINGFPMPTGGSPSYFTVDPAGRFAYLIDTSGISGFVVDSATGSLQLAPGSPYAAGIDPNSLSVDISGHFLYVTNGGDGTISAFAIDPLSGGLSPVAGSPFPAGTTPVSITTTGKIQ